MASVWMLGAAGIGYGKLGLVMVCLLHFGVVLLMPLQGLFIRPFTFNVAGLGMRYFWTVKAVRCGVPCKKLALNAFIRDEIKGLHSL